MLYNLISYNFIIKNKKAGTGKFWSFRFFYMFFMSKRSKKTTIIAILLLLIIGGGAVLVKILYRPVPKKVYAVAIMVRGQQNKDPVEDRRTSLKAGDVLVIQKDGHNWSTTERVSYLILKMNLTEEQKAKLLSPEERVIKFEELSKEEQERIKEEEKQTEERGEEYTREERRETLRARAYRIDMSEFEGFQANDLLKGQPYLDQVYNWKIVEEKPSVLK